MAGIIEVLSTSSGHDVVDLNADPAEAAKQINDFFQKKYTLFVKIDGQDFKVKSFDEATNEVVALGEVEKRISAADVKLTAVAPVTGG